MIIDRLENVSRYVALHSGFALAFAFLRDTDLAQLPMGTHRIADDQVFALVSRRMGHQPDQARLETHRCHIDIHVTLEGTDLIGWRSTLCSGPALPDYDADNDIDYYAPDPEIWTPVGPGSFAIYFPEDAHAPRISDGELHKVVVKVAC